MDLIQIWTHSLFIELLNDTNKEVWCCRSFSENGGQMATDALFASLE